MNKQHWQDWLNFLLGLWVIVSPWIIAHIMVSPATPGGVTDAAMWNHYVIGLAVAILAIGSVYAFHVWLEWTNIVLGALLVISPWVLGFTASTGLMGNAVITGLLIVLFAGLVLGEEQAPGKLAKSR